MTAGPAGQAVTPVRWMGIPLVIGSLIAVEFVRR